MDDWTEGNMGKRWSKSVDRGVDLIYSLASVEWEAGQWSAIQCRAEDAPCGKCEQCQAAQDLEEGIEWIGSQIKRHRKPRRRTPPPRGG